MSRTSIYKNPARQEERRRQREQEKQKRALQNAVKATLPAYNPGGNLRLGEDVIIANVNEWQQKATAAAAKAEERAQSALAAESHGDMKVASVFWGDSWSYDQKAKNFSAEALRYEAMLKPPKTAPKETPPAIAPKTKSPVAAVEDKKRKETEITPAVTEPAVESTLQEMVKAYSAERAAILETAENRHVLEWGNAALKDQQVWQYIQHSGADPDLDGLAMLMDAALAEYRTPTQSAGMDYAKKTANHVIGGEYTDDRTPLGSALSLTLGFTGADIFMDARDLGYDLTHLQTIPPGQLGLDALALIPGVGALKYADEAAALIKNGQRAAEAAGDMAKHGDALVDAGGELVYNGARQFGDIELKPADLMEELATSGKKYTPEDVLMVTKNSSGDLMWLEKGNEDAGLTHILEHQSDFKKRNFPMEAPEEEIIGALDAILQSEPLMVTLKEKGYEAIYSYKEKLYLVAYGTNGYIVSFYPFSYD